MQTDRNEDCSTERKTQWVETYSLSRQTVVKETYRYLGGNGREITDAVEALVEDCLLELEKAASPKHIIREFPVRLLENNEIDFKCFHTESNNLTRNLADCHLVLLFAATLGSEVDVLLRKYSKIQMSKAVILQAAAAAMIEEYCDCVNEVIRREYEQKALYLRPRFSPGYGDFSLECQRPIGAALEMSKRVGITLTDSLLMMPSKSVTAVIGISKKEHRCEIKGCEQCSKTDCAYRRG